MALSRAILDSGFLYALYDRDETHNMEAIAVAELYSARFVLPYVVLTEAAYLFRRAGGTPAVVSFLDALIEANYQYEIASPTDLMRARDIMARYTDSRLDFVDCCIMALSERLKVTQICTFDQRDFQIFRPTHTHHLELLP